MAPNGSRENSGPTALTTPARGLLKDEISQVIHMLADDFEALEGQVPLPPPDPHTQSWQERLALNLLFDLRTFCPFEGPPNTTHNFESGGPGVWGRVVLPE